MKKLSSAILALAIATGAFASDEEKTGFLTTKWCAEKGLFTDCRLETIFCGYEGCFKDEKEFKTDVTKDIVLNVHDEGMYYKVEFTKHVELGEVLEKAMNKNEVTLIGKIKGDVISVHEFEAPPPPKKSFFKGCL